MSMFICSTSEDAVARRFNARQKATKPKERAATSDRDLLVFVLALYGMTRKEAEEQCLSSPHE